MPPDELTNATDAFVKAVGNLLPTDRTEALAVFTVALSDLLAAVTGRATSMAAGAVVAVHEATQRRLDNQSQRITDLSHQLDRAKDAIERDLIVLAELMPPLDVLYKLATRMEQLEKQVGGDAAQ